MGNTPSKREGFSSGIAIFFATLSSAIGLGNIWRFPYVAGANGGGAFLFMYLLCVAVIAIPVMLSEFYIGRTTQKNSVGAFKQLYPKSKFWSNIGFFGVISSYMIMFYYSTIAGRVYMYLFKSIKGDFISATLGSLNIQYQNAVTGIFYPIMWQFITMAVVAAILIVGVKNGIEKITKTFMPILFVLILICDIRALTLPGAVEGLKFLFAIDFKEITGATILAALSFAFFKLGIGMGSMITYSSYFTKDNNMLGTAVKVSIADTIISILSGIAILPAVFSFGIAPNGGAGLLFRTIPLVFGKMPAGNILLILFFLLTSIAATGAMISLTQVSVAYWQEEKKLSRTNAVILSTGIIFIIGILATLSADTTCILGRFTVFGKTFYSFFEKFSENILLFLMAGLTSIFVGYIIKKDDLNIELTNRNTLKLDKAINVYYFVLRYITPILILIVFMFNFIKYYH